MLDDYGDFMTKNDVMQAFQIDEIAVDQLLENHAIVGISILGNVRITKESVLRYIADRTCDPGIDMVLSSQAVFPLMHLDKSMRDSDCMSDQGVDNMAYKINRSITINGQLKWIHANSEQEYADKVGLLYGSSASQAKHNFEAYAWNWFKTYSKPNIETATAQTYQRQLTKHLLPVLGGMDVEDISTDVLQNLFNGMDGKKATKDKARVVLNQILEMAVEEGYLPYNPLKSKRMRITGSASRPTSCYTTGQMQYLVRHLESVKESADRAFLALMIFHPFRLEEALGLKWADIDLEKRTIIIHRAVTHPTRNQPEIKAPKTSASNREIPLHDIAAKYLEPGNADDYVIGGSEPLSYTQYTRMCTRIQKDTGFEERITPRRFRTTVLTDIYSDTKDIKLVQAMAGHTTAAMTLKHYVKNRGEMDRATAALSNLYA